ncbi:class I SAM-dependent methyltransferase [Pyruvatibacter mobilis]|nr:class I SAM-dependent methyltransferase [Pyruvatibacter mobilis]GGD08664.1 methyltransferase [Pyruvatibacter mobilis]
MNQFMKMFDDPEAVARYQDGPRRFVPGLEALHRMSAILLAEHMAADGHLLVLGAGGGLELKAFADAHPGWRFTGIDPSAKMLELARQTLGPLAPRASLVEGYAQDAPEGPFDGAACLLTLHFLPREERIDTAAQIHKRLAPGAPFVVAHSSFPQAPDERTRWLSRYAAYAVASGVPADQAENARATVEAGISMLSPEEDADVLRQAGFRDVTPFYAAFSWRGWVAYA